MPTAIQIVNRYVNSDNVAGAAVVFDGVAIDIHSPRTRANGQVVVAIETLSDGNHVMHIVPDPTSAAPVGPAVAEGLGVTVKRMFRSLDVNIAVRNGRITTLSVPQAQALNGAVSGGTNPVRVQLQPIYHRSPFQNPNDRKGTDITLIVLHHTSQAANIRGTLAWFNNPQSQTSAHYVISPEPVPQVVKVVQDTGRSWQAGHNTSWQGNAKVNHYSIGIELSHRTGTPFPDKQIDCLLDLIDGVAFPQRTTAPVAAATGAKNRTPTLAAATTCRDGRLRGSGLERRHPSSPRKKSCVIIDRLPSGAPSRVTNSTSPASSSARARRSCGRSACAPLAVSRRTFAAPASREDTDA